MYRIVFLFILAFVVFTGCDNAFAQQVDPNAVVTENTTVALTILKGPVARIGGAIVLLVGVAALLRGRYQVSVSCAVAYAALLFLNR